jgi:hypothetical protein
MLLALPHPHHDLWIKSLLGGRIVLLPMGCPCCLCVRREARVDAVLVKDSAGVFGVQSMSVVDLPKWDKAYALR